ncbi:hypothetical protein IFM89_022269 [Coptis chinensis]|uniref:Uncharacterized protein n=1 Tax=Coptis chinensis TaxID=261450 RepID=A0A835LJH6_9MAGN|nr:hypothetical protein IFM89_022269 [Coptis chinensis]
MDNPHANTDHDMEKEMLRMENEKLRKELQIALGRLQQSQESGETEGEQQKREDAAGGDEKRKREEGRYDIEDWKREERTAMHLPNVERSIDSLTGRWKHIKKHATKFTAIMNQVENQRPSGASIEDQTTVGASLRTTLSGIVRLRQKSSKTPVRRHRRHYATGRRSNENEKMEKNGGSMAVTEVSLSCKEDKISNKDTDLEAAKISNQLKLRNLDILQREVEAREEENRIRQMNFEVKLLAMNTTVLDPATALLIKKRQAKIRASWEQEDYDGTEF